MKTFLSRLKPLLVLLAIVGLVVFIARYRQVKKDQDDRALVEEIQQCYAESFENFKYCIRPMFASSQRMAFRLWRREIRRLRSRCEDTIKKRDYADGKLTSSAQDLIGPIARVADDLSECQTGGREDLLKDLEWLDARYSAFSRTAEPFECFVEKISYCDEYK